MTDSTSEYSVLACDQQPIAVEGLRWILDRAEGFRFAGGVHTLEAAAELIQSIVPHIVILDKSFGTPALLQWLHQVSISGSATSPIVSGPSVSESEALRFLQAGARGILRRSSEPETLVICMRAVVRGTTWMEEGIFGQGGRSLEPRRPHLTQRELQVASLWNRAFAIAISPVNWAFRPAQSRSTLRHIFEKTGVRGRFGLALNALRDRGFLPAEI